MYCDDHVVVIISYFYMMNQIYWFACDELFLLPWDEAYIFVEYELFVIFCIVFASILRIFIPMFIRKNGLQFNFWGARFLFDFSIR